MKQNTGTKNEYDLHYEGRTMAYEFIQGNLLRDDIPGSVFEGFIEELACFLVDVDLRYQFEAMLSDFRENENERIGPYDFGKLSSRGRTETGLSWYRVWYRLPKGGGIRNVSVNIRAKSEDDAKLRVVEQYVNLRHGWDGLPTIGGAQLIDELNDKYESTD